jgi:hypothetical protein
MPGCWGGNGVGWCLVLGGLVVTLCLLVLVLLGYWVVLLAGLGSRCWSLGYWFWLVVRVLGFGVLVLLCWVLSCSSFFCLG